MKRFTMRSSSEWNAITARRPPGASTSSAPDERRLQRRQLLVRRDAQRLERARRGMDVPTAPAAERAGHDLRQACRGLDRRLLPLARRSPARCGDSGLFAVAPDQVGQLALREGIHQIARRNALLRIEAHVERALVTEGEPAFRLIELERRQPEIEQDAVERHDSSLSGNGGEIGEVGADRDEALGDGWVLSQRTCAVDRGGIGVEGENGPVRRRSLEQRPGMTAAAEGAVQVSPAWSRLQCGRPPPQGAQAGGRVLSSSSRIGNGSRHDRHNPGQASRPRRRTVRAEEYAPPAALGRLRSTWPAVGQSRRHLYRGMLRPRPSAAVTRSRSRRRRRR